MVKICKFYKFLPCLSQEIKSSTKRVKLQFENAADTYLPLQRKGRAPALQKIKMIFIREYENLQPIPPPPLTARLIEYKFTPFFKHRHPGAHPLRQRDMLRLIAAYPAANHEKQLSVFYVNTLINPKTEPQHERHERKTGYKISYKRDTPFFARARGSPPRLRRKQLPHRSIVRICRVP